MYMNWGSHDSSSALQGVPKGQLFSQEQGRIPVSMPQVPQQLDGSLYGTPIPNSQGNMNRHAHLQGNSLFKAVDNSSPRPAMHSSAFNASFLGGQAFGRQNLFDQVPGQDNNVGNYQQVAAYNNNVTFQEFNGLQERGGLSGIMQGSATQISSTQSSVALDPLEQKILFGTNDNVWDSSFDGCTDPGMGSWSALMQCAVEDEPISETALQEQWRGSTLNVDGGKPNAGSTEIPFVMGNDSNFFPGFQQPPQSTSQISSRHSHKNGGNWLSGNIQQSLSAEGSQQGQHIEASRQVSKNHLVDYTKSVDNTTRHMQNENTVNDLREFSNGPQGLDKFGHGGSGAYGKQPNSFQRENSIDRYNSNTFQHANTGDAREYVPSSARDFLRTDQTNQESHKQGSQRGPNYGQGFFGLSNVFDNVSNSVMDIEKGNLPEFQGISKASMDIFSRGGLGSNISDSFDRSIGLNAPNHNAQSRGNVHELDQTVNHLRKDGITHLGSAESQSSSHLLNAETSNAHTDQLYNQSSVSQGFGLRLAPPFERMANPNLLQFSQGSSQIGSNLNQRHVNQELGENSQGWMTPPSERASQIEPRDGKLSSSGQMGVRSSHMNVQGASPSQIQRQHGPNAPVPFQSFQAFPGPASRFQPSNLGPSQDTSRPTNFKSFNQEFPVLEAAPVPQQPTMSEQGEVSAKLHNVWTKIPIHRLSSNAESQKVYSTDSLNNNLETTSFASEARNEQTSHLDGNEESEISTSLRDQEVVDFGKGKQSIRSQHQISSKIQDSASQAGNFLQGPQSAPMHQQDFNRVWQGDNQSLGSSSHEAFAHSLQKSDVYHQNQSLLQQTQVTRNVKTHQGANSNLDPQQLNVMTGQQSFNGQNTRIGNHTGNDINAMPYFQPGSSGNFLSGATVNNPAQALTSQPLLNTHSPHMASFPFLQYGNVNGQMMSLSDPTNVAVQFEKPPHDIHTHTSYLQVNSAMTSQIDGVSPREAATLAVNEPSSTPFMSSSDAIDQSLAVTGPKKRKTATSELLPWNQEVTESSPRLQNISMAQIEWAQATNRLTEKVDYKHVQIEDGNPLLRSKKRLILTTQLVQQLFRPPPATIFSADATSGFDGVAYYVARLALGDACSMASCKRSDFLLSQEKSNMTSEKQLASERAGGQFLSKVIEGFTVRAKKLENDLLRLDKKASTVDLLVECQDLDKFAIINRFAKFHVRAPTDTVENSSNPSRIATPSKIYLQRYVSAFPLPSRVPEGIHCLSL